jgi:hypothetical protein
LSHPLNTLKPKVSLMTLKTRTFTLLIAAAATAMISISSISYENIGLAHGNEESSNYADNLVFLSNCISDNGLDGPIKWFEPLACNADSDSTQESLKIHTEKRYGSDNAGINMIDNNMNVKDNLYVYELYADFEDPYEVGWD